MCTATKFMSCIIEKRRREGERCSFQLPVFNQSHMAQPEEPDRKRAWFSKFGGEFLAKLKNESVPAATKRSTSSSCHRV